MMATTDEDERVVRTTLDESEYQEFRQLAERDGISVEEALDRAIRGYVAQRRHVPPDDPMFEVDHDHEEAGGEPTDARNLDAYVYGEDVERGEGVEHR